MNVAIIGAGASGCICAYYLGVNEGISVTLFDKNLPLQTLLPTGGGRCNLAHAEYDFRELAKNYPRGEKFLYSVFSRFSTADTIEMFEKMGIKTYVQEDGRIFPKSNSSKNVQTVILKELRKLGVKFVQTEIADIQTQLKDFDSIVVAIGGHAGYEILKPFGIKIIEPRPSLVGLKTEENFKNLSGITIRGASVNGIVGDILFTHFGISGPLIYTVSSINAFKEIPYKLTLDLCPDFIDLQEKLNTSPHKEIKNILSEFLSEKVTRFIIKDFDATTKANQVNGKMRDEILNRIHNFTVTVIGTNKGEETVTAGGVDLDEINPKNMELKRVPNLYCIGEVLNIDGFCGGFNLQNAWSTAYICAQGLLAKRQY